MRVADSRVRYISKCVRNYDYDLFAERDYRGLICVYRKKKRFDLICYDDDFKLFNIGNDREFVFALTDNWRANGRPVDYGYERIHNKLKDMDHWENERLLDELEAKNEKIDNSKKRHFRNETEAALSDNYKAIQKGFGDILTHSMSKDDEKKRRRDKRIKQF